MRSLKPILSWTFAAVMLVVLGLGVRNVFTGDAEILLVTSTAACTREKISRKRAKTVQASTDTSCQPKLVSKRRNAFWSEYAWKVGENVHQVRCRREWLLLGSWQCSRPDAPEAEAR